MPARIFRIEPTAQLGLAAQQQASAADFGGLEGQALAQGGSQIAQQATGALADLARVDAIMRRDEIDADVKEKAAAVQSAYTDEIIRLQEDGTDPALYASKAEAALKGFVSQGLGSLRYQTPESQRAYQRAVGGFIISATKEAKMTGFERRGALVEAQDGARLEELERIASTASGQGRADALLEAQDIINKGVASKRYSGEKADALTRKTLRGMQAGIVSRDFANPETRAVTVQRLMAGQVPHIGPLVEQQALARTLQDRADTEYTKAQAAAKKDFDERKVNALREFSAVVADKSTTLPAIRAFGTQWNLTAGEQEHLEKRYNAPMEEPPSNPQVRQDVALAVNRAVPTIGEAGLRAKYDPRGGTGLNTKDFEEQTKALIARTQHIREYGQTLAMQRYSQAEQEGFLALGIVPQQLESLNPSSKVLISQFIGELSARAFPNPDKKYEDPFTVKNELIPRYQAALQNKALADIEEIRSTLAFPMRSPVHDQNVLQATSMAIEQAFADGRLNRDRYEVEKNKWRQMKEADDVQRKIREKVSEGGAKIKAPAYTGTRATD